MIQQSRRVPAEQKAMWHQVQGVGKRRVRRRFVTFNDDGRHFINFTKLSMVLCGALRQPGAKLEVQTQRLNVLEGR